MNLNLSRKTGKRTIDRYSRQRISLKCYSAYGERYFQQPIISICIFFTSTAFTATPLYPCTVEATKVLTCLGFH